MRVAEAGTGGARYFLDSNVLLYLLSADAAKAHRAESLLALRPAISIQVLNEITHVGRRKTNMSWPEIGQFLDLVRAFCTVLPLTLATHELACTLAARHRLAFYDACIIASAWLEGCHTLYTEDMHHGLVIEGRLSILTPFLPA